ncbi:MAG: Fe-S cluster assembly protein SufD [Flavobacteriales bacterium]
MIMETAVQHPMHETLMNLPFKDDSALQSLHDTAIPTTRDEVWKYTRVARLLQHKWKHVAPTAHETIQEEIPAEWNAHVVDFIHGVCQRQDEELEPGVRLKHEPVASGAVPSHYFEYITQAAYTSSIHIEVANGVQATRPILIRHYIEHMGNIALPRIQLTAGEQSHVQVIEQFMSATHGAVFTIRTLSMLAKAGSRVDWMKFQNDSEHSFLMNHEYIDVMSDAHVEMHTTTWSSGWVRNQLHIRLQEAGGFAKLNGVFLPRNSQFIDNHTRVDHIAPHCESSELYKGILTDRGVGVFNGKVHVHPQAQKTNAFQKNANMLMTAEAQMNTKPELEIYADNVKCSHGSTTGRMDTEALFYLKSRGIGEGQAQKLLSRAFIGEVLDQLPNSAVRDWAYQSMVKQEFIFE